MNKRKEINHELLGTEAGTKQLSYSPSPIWCFQIPLEGTTQNEMYLFFFSGALYFSTTAAVWTYFPTPNRERSLKLCYTSWCAQCPLTWQRELLVKTAWLCKRKKSVLFLLYHCFKMNFRSDLQKLRYQKHMYFRYCLSRVRQFLFVHFHWGKQFPQNKTCEGTDYHWMWSFPSSA